VQAFDDIHDAWIIQLDKKYLEVTYKRHMYDDDLKLHIGSKLKDTDKVLLKKKNLELLNPSMMTKIKGNQTASDCNENKETNSLRLQ
jgi:hypothetical protein